VAMSPRNFARVFRRSVGITPARYVEKLRVEAVRRRLEETRSTVDDVAAQCGFGTRELMRRAFQRTLRVSPTGVASRTKGELHEEAEASAGVGCIRVDRGMYVVPTCEPCLRPA